MKFKKWLFSALSLIFLFLSMWLIIWTAAALKNHPKDNLATYLPKDTKFAVRVYANNIMQKFYRELLFYKRDPSNQNLIKDIIEQKIKSADEDSIDRSSLIENFKGIDLYNDFIFFQFSRNQKDYNGILCHVKDASQFLENVSDNDKFKKVCNHNVGLILFPMQKDVQIAELSKLSEEIITTENTGIFNSRRATSDALFDLFYQIQDENGTFSKLALALDINEKRISLNGTLTPAVAKTKDNSSYVLQGKNLNIKAFSIPQILNNELNKWLNENAIPPISVRELQLNYEGLAIELNPTQLNIKPKFEAIVKSTERLNVKSFLANPNLLQLINGKLDSNFVAINDAKYFFEQLDSCTFYIGNNLKPVYEKVKTVDEFSLIGELDHLTNISTGGMDVLLNIIPLYAAINRYFIVSNHAALHVTQDDYKYIIKGNLDFNSQQNAFFESIILGSEIQELNSALK